MHADAVSLTRQRVCLTKVAVFRWWPPFDLFHRGLPYGDGHSNLAAPITHPQVINPSTGRKAELQIQEGQTRAYPGKIVIFSVMAPEKEALSRAVRVRTRQPIVWACGREFHCGTVGEMRRGAQGGRRDLASPVQMSLPDPFVRWVHLTSMGSSPPSSLLGCQPDPWDL